jgi:hypothetical protein
LLIVTAAERQGVALSLPIVVLGDRNYAKYIGWKESDNFFRMSGLRDINERLPEV